MYTKHVMKTYRNHDFRIDFFTYIFVASYVLCFYYVSTCKYSGQGERKNGYAEFVYLEKKKKKKKKK